ncbi:hypothetical protein BDW62DRAFT_205293 [Aspergillus aurantiobrunneus]
MPRTLGNRSTRLPRANPAQPDIQSFARATKPGLSSSPVKDGKKDHPVSTRQLPVSPSKKRKLHELENVDFAVQQPHQQGTGVQDTEKNEDVENLATKLTPSKSLKFSSLSVSSPRSGHYVASSVPSSPSRRSTRAARTTSQDGNVSSPLSPPSTPSKRASARAPKPGPRSDSRVLPAPRPSCVEDLVSLHSAFLKAVAVHAAHSGVGAPADLREFLPSVERIWKKRKVGVRDLQRLLWVSGGKESGFRLANHGLGRVCLERVAGREGGIGDEGVLQGRFETRVGELWGEALDGEVDFMGMLGLAQIEESLAPFTTFRKGQQRLQDLKGGVIKVKMEGLLAEEASGEGAGVSPGKVRAATMSRRQGLLDRIKNKELRQAKLPPPPSKDVLLRRAAVGRVEEVAGVLALLRPAGYVGSGPMARMAAQRTPFCLETVVQNVQDSTRNPISDKEVEACLEILSREDVAGHWVSIVVVNQLKSVVLRSCGDVQLKEIGAKVSQLKHGWEESAKLLD